MGRFLAELVADNRTWVIVGLLLVALAEFLVITVLTVRQDLHERARRRYAPPSEPIAVHFPRTPCSIGA